MATIRQLNAWLDALKATGALEDAQVSDLSPTLVWARRHGVVAHLVGGAQVLGRDVRVRVGVTEHFPDDLPYVQLVDEDLPKRATAHLESDGNVCFTATREMVFDPERPVELLQEALGAALGTLAASWTAPDNAELLDEFASYWSHAQPSQGHLRALPLYATPDDRLREMHAWRSADIRQRDAQGRPIPPKPGKQNTDPTVIAVADDLDAPRAFDQLSLRVFGAPGLTVLYVPLVASPTLLPPAPGQPWSATEFRQVVRGHLFPADLAQLDVLLAGRRSSRDLIVMGVPRPTGVGVGRRAAVAVRLSGMRGGHALLPAGTVEGVRLEMQDVVRRDRPFLMQRGGSDDQLGHQRVLLLGCGALGGHLAFMLAGAGIGHLTLVDHDRFSHDNAFRHVLGRRFVGEPKAEGMALALRERYPYLEVTPGSGWTMGLVSGGRVDLRDFDLIVDATGNATHHLGLARLLRERPGHPPTLLSWLDVLGLGGHAATVFSGQAGCPRCLYSDPRAPLCNVASFSAPGQELGRDALGCGSYFTPFSDLDAVRTAEFAARHAVALLNGRETRSVVFSWKGDPGAFRAAGHRLAQRFEVVRRKQLRAGMPYATPRCTGCGGRP